ncbi:MAG: HD domain-containing protein [Wenzhouxiangellaceae bacterium]|nr:HD domain-containing protein [Wenzhouxiangellaceae bacterium]MBS3824840.1 HD domain-containing protein [Wenzhouxiangellaceae bacterium]
MSGSESELDHEKLFESECLVDPAELQIGHFVSRLDRGWRDTPFPLEGAMILSEDTRSWFVENCGWVVIDLLRSRNGYRPPSARDYRPRAAGSPVEADSGGPINMLRRARLTEKSVHEAVDCHDLLYKQAAALIDSLKKSGQIDVEQARLGLRKIAGSLESNVAAMIWLTRIRHADEHVAEHSVNVAILAMGLARSLEWDDEEIERAGLAGLLHDLGKMRLDPDIVNKPGERTAGEVARLQEHSRIGFELLRDDERIHPEVARAVLEHHERPDGKGYPDGKHAAALLPLSKLIAVVNQYDAMTSHWPFRSAVSHHETLGMLWRERDRRFDAGMVEKLIQFLGWVTPGILVRLSSGDYAVVLQTSQEHRLWPIVRRLRRKGADYVGAERIDLARQSRRGEKPVLKIAEVLPDGAVEVDLNAILLAEAVADED